MHNIEEKQGYKFTEEFDYIPEDWDVAKIKDKSEVKTGGTPNTSISEYCCNKCSSVIKIYSL